MTGDEAVTLVRTNFGEATAATLSDAEIQDWIDQAAQQVFNLLPPGELRTRINEDSVAAGGGEVDIPTDWDKIVDVLDASGSVLQQVHFNVISAIDRFSAGGYFQPDESVWAQIGNVIYVRPDPTPSSITIRHTERPTPVATWGNDLETEAGIPLNYHGVLVDLATSYAYAQEEDERQAGEYLNRAMNVLISRGAGVGGEE